MREPRIRLMAPKDLEAVHAIESHVSMNPWTRHIFENCLQRYHCWVIEDKGEVVAFGILMVAALEAHVLNIAVKQSHQRKGLGRHLLTFMIRKAEKEAETILLEVRVTNTSAIALYKKLGFKPIALRQNYYETKHGREDAQVFSRNLP